MRRRQSWTLWTGIIKKGSTNRQCRFPPRIFDQAVNNVGTIFDRSTDIVVSRPSFFIRSFGFSPTTDHILPCWFGLSSSGFSSIAVSFYISCSDCPALAALPMLSYPACPDQAAFSKQSCLDSHALIVLSLLSCPGCPVLTVLAILFCLSCPGCPALAFLFCMSYSTFLDPSRNSV
jgi:hypothetical protein